MTLHHTQKVLAKCNEARDQHSSRYFQSTVHLVLFPLYQPANRVRQAFKVPIVGIRADISRLPFHNIR